MPEVHCCKCLIPIDTDEDAHSFRAGYHCSECEKKLPTTEILSRLPMAKAQVEIIPQEDGSFKTCNGYWSRYTGGTNDWEILRQQAGHHRCADALSGPFPDRATAIESARERAIAFFQPIAEMDCGLAQGEAREMLTELKAA